MRGVWLQAAAGGLTVTVAGALWVLPTHVLSPDALPSALPALPRSAVHGPAAVEIVPAPPPAPRAVPKHRAQLAVYVPPPVATPPRPLTHPVSRPAVPHAHPLPTLPDDVRPAPATPAPSPPAAPVPAAAARAYARPHADARAPRARAGTPCRARSGTGRAAGGQHPRQSSPRRPRPPRRRSSTPAAWT